jgi:hypothetical protein
VSRNNPTETQDSEQQLEVKFEGNDGTKPKTVTLIINVEMLQQDKASHRTIDSTFSQIFPIIT